MSPDHEVEKVAFKSALVSEFDTCSVPAVNEGVTDVVLNVDSVIDIIVEGKESNIVEENTENSLEENIETAVEDHSRNLFRTDGNSSNGKSDEAAECPNKLTNVGSISSNNDLSSIRQADFEGGFSNPLNVNKGVETEESMMGKSINLQSDELDDQSVEDDKANNVQEDHQDLVEFDSSGNPDPVREHSRDVSESQEPVKDAENWFQVVEKLCTVLPHDITKESLEENHYEIATGNTTVLLPSTYVPESHDGTAVPDETRFSRETRIGFEEDLHSELSLTSVVQDVIHGGSETKLESDGIVLSVLDKNVGQVNEKKNQESSDGCSDEVSHKINDEKAGQINVTMSPDHEVEKVAFKSALVSEFDTCSVPAVNEGVTDVVLNVDSVVDIIVEGKESNIVEENTENSLEENIETDVEDHSRNLFRTDDNSGNGKSDEAAECPNKLTNVGSISSNNDLSSIRQADFEGGFSNPLNVNKGVETEESMMGKSINLQSDELDDQSVEDDKANNVQEDHQDLVEFDSSGNPDPVREHSRDVSESQEPVKDAENWFQVVEKLCTVLPHDITKESLEENHYEIATGNTTVLLPSTYVPESHDGTAVPDETRCSRETRIGSEEELHSELSLTSVVQDVIHGGSETKLESDGIVLSVLDKNVGQVNEKKNQESSDGCSDEVSHKINDEKAGQINVTMSPDHEVEKVAFKSALASEFDTCSVPAVNEGVTDVVLNVDSVIDIIVEGKESNIVEENTENSLEENIETAVEDHSRNLFRTDGNSSNGKSDEAAECPNKLTNVGSISSNNDLSSIRQARQADFEGGFSNPLNVNKGVETEESMMGKSINLQSDELDDQSVEDDKANNVQEDHQDLVEFDSSGNPDPVREHSRDVSESQEPVKDAENWFQVVEKLCTVLPHDITKESLEENHYEIATGNTTVLLPSTYVPESHDGTAVPDETRCSRETRIGSEEELHSELSLTSVVQDVIHGGSETKLESDGIVLSVLDKNVGQVNEKKNQESSDGCSDEVSHKINDEKAGQINVTMSSDHEVEKVAFKSALVSELDTCSVPAVNEGVTDVVLNVDSVVDIIVEGKESNIVEENTENSLEKNIETDVEDHSLR
ncbi:uncharacterized protein LOC21387972 [Morus notabilis]|uniref:uncharacterized protein LOC21387972 n=1 Tax=Morus notabilis TaxID=981085 RepID=UPI000CECE57C|nr:uncharacterized protein LOC21387972 [Morus notabilis]